MSRGSRRRQWGEIGFPGKGFKLKVTTLHLHCGLLLLFSEKKRFFGGVTRHAKGNGERTSDSFYFTSLSLYIHASMYVSKATKIRDLD